MEIEKIVSAINCIEGNLTNMKHLVNDINQDSDTGHEAKVKFVGEVDDLSNEIAKIKDELEK